MIGRHRAALFATSTMTGFGIASTARDCMCCIDSPPGNTTALGLACTVRQSGSFARSASLRPCHSP